MKNFFIALVGLVLLISALAVAKGLQIKALVNAGETMVPPPLSVSSSAVTAYEWESTLSAIGSLEAAKGLVLTADLSGRVTKINFSAGSQVKAGDLLIEQDVSTEKAQLRAAQSSLALQKSNFNRIKQLYERKVATRSEYDSANSAYQSARAEVDNIRAAIEKKSIRAPFDGRLGIRLVNLGQTINAGEPVVSLQAADQMFVNFFLPQQQLSLLEDGLAIRLTSDAVPGEIFKGKINAINPEIDTSTRSVEIQAILANPDNKLSPGMFASIDVVLPTTEDVLLIPITAVQYATFGDSVFVIEPAKAKAEEDASITQQAAANDEQKTLIARQQFVRLGESRGDFVVVKKGLSPGDLVASAGGFKLRNGASVVVNNTVIPDFSLEPKLKDQ